MGELYDAPISVDSLHISLVFFVIKSPPFDVIFREPTSEALSVCLGFGS